MPNGGSNHLLNIRPPSKDTGSSLCKGKENIPSRTWNGVVPVYMNAIRPDRCSQLLSTCDGHSDERPAVSKNIYK